MQGKFLFEYAIIRIVPRVEREEFVNTGVIIYCKDLKYLKCIYTLNKERVNAICGKVDCREVEEHLESFDRICKGAANGGPIAILDLPSRFRWLTATRSTVVQTSRVHPGMTADPEETLQKLFRQQVL